MKTQNTVRLLSAALLSIALLAGCGGSANESKGAAAGSGADAAETARPNAATFTAENGMYAVSLPGTWSEDGNMGASNILSLSGDDGAGLIVMGLTKAQLTAAGAEVKSLDDFYDFAEATMLNGAAASSAMDSAEAIPLPGFLGTFAAAGKMTQANGASGDIFVQCAESETAYYFIAFSAASGQYDKMLASLRDGMRFEELELPEAAPLTDTLCWFNAAYAVITSLNGGDLNLVAGFEPGEMIRQIEQGVLERDWGVTDRASLEETIDWLLTEGHNAGALSLLDDLGAGGMSRDELIGFMEEIGFYEEELTDILAAYDAKAAYGENAIAGWDLSRAMSLMGWGYLAGYYTYEEAMDQSLETARRIQQTFGSWDDFFNSYFYGYSYWSEEALDDASSQAYARHALYEELKSDPAGVFRVDWNAALDKEW